MPEVRRWQNMRRLDSTGIPANGMRTIVPREGGSLPGDRYRFVRIALLAVLVPHL